LRGSGSEDDGDGSAAIELSGANEATSGGICRACFHAVAVWDIFEEPVGILEQAGATIGVGEVVAADAHALAEEGDPVNGPGQNSHVAGGGILVGFGEAVGVEEIGLRHSEGTSGLIHESGEQLFGACNVAAEGHRDIISAFDDEGLEEVLAGISFSLFKVEFGGFYEGVGSFHDHFVGEGTGAHDDEPGEELLSAGDCAFAVGVLLKKDAAGDGVDDHGAFRRDRGCTGFRKGGANYLRRDKDCLVRGWGSRAAGRIKSENEKGSKGPGNHHGIMMPSGEWIFKHESNFLSTTAVILNTVHQITVQKIWQKDLPNGNKSFSIFSKHTRVNSA
jgi:hypothetical protein